MEIINPHRFKAAGVSLKIACYEETFMVNHNLINTENQLPTNCYLGRCYLTILQSPINKETSQPDPELENGQDLIFVVCRTAAYLEGTNQ